MLFMWKEFHTVRLFESAPDQKKKKNPNWRKTLFREHKKVFMKEFHSQRRQTMSELTWREALHCSVKRDSANKLVTDPCKKK